MCKYAFWYYGQRIDILFFFLKYFLHREVNITLGIFQQEGVRASGKLEERLVGACASSSPWDHVGISRASHMLRWPLMISGGCVSGDSWWLCVLLLWDLVTSRLRPVPCSREEIVFRERQQCLCTALPRGEEFDCEGNSWLKQSPLCNILRSKSRKWFGVSIVLDLGPWEGWQGTLSSSLYRKHP